MPFRAMRMPFACSISARDESASVELLGNDGRAPVHVDAHERGLELAGEGGRELDLV